MDFFGDTVEKIKPYDIVTGERLAGTREISVLAATDVFVSDGDRDRIRKTLEKELKTFKTSDAYSRAKEIADEILSDPAGEKSSFILPLTENATDFFSVLPENAVLIFDECKTLWDKFNVLYKEHEERFHRLEAGGEAFGFTLFQYAEKDSFLPPFPVSAVSRCRPLRENPSFLNR